MKFLLLTAFLLPTLLYGQAKMTGIGMFKIDGSTTAVVDSLSKETGVSIEQGTYSDVILSNGSGKTKAIYMLKAGEDDELFIPMADPRFIDHPDFHVYYVDYYTISGVPFESVYLFFYKKSLYRIECDGSNDIKEAMKLKYGGENIKVKEKKVKCRSGVGVEYTETEKTYTTTWSVNNPGIICQFETSVLFDSKCKKIYGSSFMTESAKISPIANKIISDAIKSKKDAKDDIKKSKLKDF